MKDVSAVLREKEQDVKRVRREIQALAIVIPLLKSDQREPDDVMHLPLASTRMVMDPSGNGMADLETYYPFVKTVRVSESG